jgi:hypothetical protein
MAMFNSYVKLPEGISLYIHKWANVCKISPGLKSHFLQKPGYFYGRENHQSWMDLESVDGYLRYRKVAHL